MKKFVCAVISMMALVLTSCSSEDLLPDETEQKVVNNDEFSMIVRYKGNIYNVPCILENDSLIYLDESFNELYNKEISNNPNLAIYATKDENGNDVISYYEDVKTLENDLNVEYMSEDSNYGSRTSRSYVGRAILYDDRGYADRNVILDLYSDARITIFSLKEYASFNDKTSSIEVYNYMEPGTTYYIGDVVNGGRYFRGSELRACLISYEDTYFKGKVL
ncbi:MAG: hypothetical protein NC117_09070 [Pseudoflavonifractor sp.]|nr:hypothetical protein [Pseudoflavonifractor sp.]